MALRKYSLVWFSSVLIVALTGQSARAFTILPGPGTADIHYSKQEDYEFGVGGRGTTLLTSSILANPPSLFDRSGYLTPLPRGGTFLFQQVLKNNFSAPDWDFQSAARDLKGSFFIFNHFACGVQTPCGGHESGYAPILGGVGAVLDLEYRPNRRRGDPIPGTGNLHWIQWVTASYGPNGFGFPGFIDNGNRVEDPFYDVGSNAAGEDFFNDRPYTNGFNDISTFRYFSAELYLVREITPLGSNTRTVEIYNGVRWGWQNKITDRSPQPSKKFFDSLGAGEQDNFRLDKLTPRANFIAWINNDLPSNRCNPNTYLSAYSDDGSFYSSDNDSSFLGDGFASALTGTLSDDGTLNLAVRAVGRRGEDRGNYELYVGVSDNPSPPPPPVSVGGSGGGGFGSEGRTQQNPILPKAVEQGWQVFRNVPSCRWYDPPTTYGFEFQALEDTLFTEILDFPVGDDNLFTVLIGDTILGEFGPGQSVDFVSLFGSGVSNFKITGIDSLFGDTEETAFPIQLAFNNRAGSFKMRPLSETPAPQSVPESSSFLGLLALGAWSAWSLSSLKKRK